VDSPHLVLLPGIWKDGFSLLLSKVHVACLQNATCFHDVMMSWGCMDNSVTWNFTIAIQ